MPKKDEKAADKAPQKPSPDTGPETANVAFDDIIDAILGADPEAVRDHQKQRQRRKKETSRT